MNCCIFRAGYRDLWIFGRPEIAGWTFRFHRWVLPCTKPSLLRSHDGGLVQILKLCLQGTVITTYFSAHVENSGDIIIQIPGILSFDQFSKVCFLKIKQRPPYTNEMPCTCQIFIWGWEAGDSMTISFCISWFGISFYSVLPDGWSHNDSEVLSTDSIVHFHPVTKPTYDDILWLGREDQCKILPDRLCREQLWLKGETGLSSVALRWGGQKGRVPEEPDENKPVILLWKKKYTRPKRIVLWQPLPAR